MSELSKFVDRYAVYLILGFSLGAGAIIVWELITTGARWLMYDMAVFALEILVMFAIGFALHLWVNRKRGAKV